MAMRKRTFPDALDAAHDEIAEINVPGVYMLTPGESWQLFDQEAQRELGMSGLAFMAAWQNGEFFAAEERLDVMRVAMLMPGAWE